MTILGLLYVYMAGHLFMWYILDLKWWGKTAMVGVPSLLAGHINAAAILVLGILLSVLVFGRGFCGWACHMRGAVEFADWTMRKLGLSRYLRLREKNVLLNTRYRWLLRIGALYILLLPVLLYLKRAGFHPQFNLLVPPPLSDLPSPDAATSLDGESLWNHFPLTLFDPSQHVVLYTVVAVFSVLLIIFIMSFVMNYFYGQGAFCRILCPYGAMLAGLVNINPWQRKMTRVADCQGCRKCAAACPQGIDVSREIYHYEGKVRNRECIKCQNCADACPHGVLKDSGGPAAPQASPRKEYEAAPWLSEERHLQKTEAMGPVVDFLSILFALLCGAALSRLGGFHFFVGAVLGFIVFRQVALLFVPRARG
jgi:polyferredoxin